MSKLILAHVGDDSMEFTCPRCGWPCDHLVRSYYESPWNEWGGKCSACIAEAVLKYERDGWPEDPRDPKKAKPKDAQPAPTLFER